MKKIAVIGAGQLGSRHLQALALLEQSFKLIVIDPGSASLSLAKERFEQIEGHERHELMLIKKLDELQDKEVDLVVVATNSGVRFQLVMDLLAGFQVKYLVLEKFLFQRASDYQTVQSRLKQTGTVCFVNCPRRMYPSYKKIKGILPPGTILQMEVVGNNWGLGCNGIHFVDLFQYLCGEAVLQWDNHLNPGHHESKREGYVEFSGRISGESKNGNALSITSFAEGPINLSVRVSTPAHRFVVNEAFGKVWHESISGQQVELEELDFSMLHQSQMTHLVATQLFEKGDCQLTPYEDSVRAHLPFLGLMLEHYNFNRTEKTDLCPIT